MNAVSEVEGSAYIVIPAICPPLPIVYPSPVIPAKAGIHVERPEQKYDFLAR